MADDGLPEGWEILKAWLPEDLDRRARDCGFFRRARGLQDSECWLRLMLMHVAGGLSLQQTAVRARELQLAQVSGVALYKRLRQAEKWLQNLTAHLLKEHDRLFGSAHGWPSQYRMRIIDATEIDEPGDTGTKLRVHYSLRLPELTCDHYELTDEKGGEKLGRYSFAPGDLVLVDRGYSHRAGVAAVLEARAHVLVRWNPAVFPVENKAGTPWDPLLPLRGLKGFAAVEWKVWFTYGGRRYPLRLCARRKSRLATERARGKIVEKARRNGTEQPSARSLELGAYILTLTSLPRRQASAAQALELYRLRWQIELAFKRLKSLLAFGHVPKSDDASAKSWMQAKILTALLIERVIAEGRFFSPWGYDSRRDASLGGLH